MKDLLNYVDDCIEGRIICCEKHKWACLRFRKDHAATYAPGSRFIFDWKKVEKVLKWARLFEHTKGILTGKPIELHISQVFVVANIYGFYYRETGYRRFQKFYFQVARKNAKSQLLAVLLTYELMVFLNGGMAEVYCAATKREQADIVYKEIKAILDKCGKLAGRWKEAYHRIQHLKSGSFCRAMSKEDRKLGDGLNPQCACIDEYHAHPTTEVYDILDSAMGARPEPLLGIITTAGFDLNHPCYKIEYNLVTKILNPADETDLESVFCDVHELETNTLSEDITVGGKKVAPGQLIDDPFDESVWPKANPIVCSYIEGVSNLRKRAQEAKAAPDKMRNYLTKHMNVWVNQRDSGYMPLTRWTACEGEIPDLKGESCFAGLDLSARNDLTSAGLVFPVGETYVIIGHSFMPESRFNEKMKTDLVPYDLWEQQGWLTLTRGEVVNYKTVTEWAITEVEKRGAIIQEWCVDPWGSVQVSNDLIEEGYEVVDIVQGIKTLSEPTKDFRNQIYEKNVIHEGNPLISWAIGNAVVDIVDRNMNILLNKSKSRERIDPIASIINGYVRAMTGGSKGCYNRRGMREL